MGGKAYNQLDPEATLLEIMVSASEAIERKKWIRFTEESMDCMNPDELADAIASCDTQPTYRVVAIDELTDKILEWHLDRKITINGNSLTQTVKLAEEMGELSAGIIRNNKKEIKDALGDMYVVMCAIAELEGTTMASCISTAYDEIKDRTGYLNEHGNYVKDE